MLSTILLTETIIFIVISFIYAFVLVKENNPTLTINKEHTSLLPNHKKAQYAIFTSVSFAIFIPVYIALANSFFINIGISIMGLFDFTIFAFLADTLWGKKNGQS